MEHRAAALAPPPPPPHPLAADLAALDEKERMVGMVGRGDGVEGGAGGSKRPPKVSDDGERASERAMTTAVACRIPTQRRRSNDAEGGEGGGRPLVRLSACRAE